MVIIDLIDKLIDKKRKLKPKARQVYAVGTGVYVGEMLVYCKKDNVNYYFLSIPKNINRTVPIDKFELALEHKIAEFAVELPRKVYNICYKQFEYNQKNTK
jgi:hypothetical protein